jgi:peroxiredoxin
MSKLKIGDKAIPFALPGVDDREHSLANYADKEIIVVVFSCNHCPYVLAWEDRMIQVQADYADRGVQLIAICANDAQKYPADSFPKMKEHAQEKGFNFPYLHDETQEVAHFYGAGNTPEFFVFDKKGILRYHGALDDNYDDPGAVKKQYLRDALDRVLAGQTPAIAETPAIGCTIKWK